MDTLTGADTHVLRELFSRAGPVTSVYFDLRASDVEEALPRWRAIAEDLARQGAPAQAVDAVEGDTLGAVPGPGVRATFAVGAEVVQTVDMPDAAQPDLARHGGLPHVLPLLGWLQGRAAYVTALVDRTGADVTAYPGGTAAPVAGEVSGPDDEIERNAPGGWAQGRYQHRAEDSWEHNATEVAEVLTRALHHYDAHLLFLAGDVRALQYLEKHLPTQVKRDVTIRRVSGGRSVDGSWLRRAEQVADDVRLAVEGETAALLAQLDEGRRPDGRAVEGAGPTLDALAAGRVRTLLLSLGAAPARTAWYGPEAHEVTADPGTAQQPDVPWQSGPLDDVAVRAALMTRAEVRLVAADATGAPAEGIGAICRYA
jgi:peptide subunit release factor 1 (eRF1)